MTTQEERERDHLHGSYRDGFTDAKAIVKPRSEAITALLQDTADACDVLGLDGLSFKLNNHANRLLDMIDQLDTEFEEDDDET